MKSRQIKRIKKTTKVINKTEDIKNKQIITVKNAEGDPDTTAEIVVQNNIDYTPKVSVIIPVYNVEEYLRQCLDSVVNQTLREIEIICVDDGSTDKSLEILLEYASKDKRISVLKQENLHAGVARNAGLAVARGEYLSFLDSDDFFELNMHEEMYKKAKEDDADVVVCKYKEFNLRTNSEKVLGYNESIYSLYTSGKKNLFYEKLYNFCSPVPWNKLYNHNFITDNNICFQNTIIANDIYMFLKAFSMAEKIVTVPSVFIHYRKFQKNSLMSRREQNFLIPFEPYNKFKDTISEDIFKKVKTSFDERLKSIVNLTEPWVEDRQYYYFQLIDYTKKINKYVADILLAIIKEKAPLLLLEYRSSHNEIISISDEELENIDKIFEKNILVSRLQNREYFRYLSHKPENVEEYSNKTKKADYAFIHGSGTWSPQPETVEYAVENNIPLIRMEDGFLRSADTWCNHMVDVKYITGIAFTFTNDVFYFDATRSSFMERQINDPNFKLTKDQKKRAQNAIKTIVDNHLTKYNHQPIFEPQIGRKGVKKILVVDQSYGDFSIKQGLADDNTFKEMLEAAIRENPNADVIVKTHPDAIAPGTKKPLGYYSSIKEHDNIYLLREPINPISLLKYVDKVYVCTTQFGMEALLCGKEVHTFGMPFYAGWGLTVDKLKNPRRTAKRTLEELFYIAYIKNTHYVDPVNKCPCNIERAMEYLIELREEYKKYLTVPKVSVIIPVYNVEQYLRECLDSVIKQTLEHIEIICINDCSPDGCAKILKEYALKDKRIKIYENPVNSGLGYSRNLGVQKAQGKYVFFLDSDDFIAKETLENLYNKIEQNQAELCQYLLSIYDNSTRELAQYIYKFFNPIRKINATYNYKYLPQLIFERVEAPLKLYKRDFLIDNNIKFFEGCYFEDTIVHIKCMSLAKKICFVDKAYYFYRKNRDGQITGKSENTNKFLDVFNYINESEKFFKNQNMWEEIKSYYYKFAIGRICSYYNQCNNSTKIKFAKKARLWCKDKKMSELKKAAPDKFEQFYSIVNRTSYLRILCNYLFFPYYLLALLFLRAKKERILEKQKLGQKKKTKIIKKTSYVKLFKVLPVFSVKKSGGKKVWNILGIPFFKKRVSADKKIVKYYFLGINILQTGEKSAEVWR